MITMKEILENLNHQLSLNWNDEIAKARDLVEKAGA